MTAVTPTQEMNASAPTARPTGVTILAILSAIGAVVLALVALAAGAIIGTMSAFLPGPLALLGAGGAVLVTMGLLLVAALSAAISFGFFKGLAWSWYIALALYAFGALSALIDVLSGTFSSILGLAIDLFLIWYITAPGVEAWFHVNVKVPWHKTA